MAKPRWTLEDVLRRARIGNRMGVRDATLLERRMPAGFFEQLRADRAFLGDPAARDASALLNQVISTAAERDAAAAGYKFVSGVREIIKREKDAPEELRKALGIGDGLDASDTDGVALALQKIAEREAALGEYGVLPEDLTEGRELRTRLLAADSAQEAARDQREGTTEERLDAHLRLEAAVGRLSARGAFAHRNNAVVAGRYERLVAGSGPTAEDEEEAGDEPVPVAPAPAPADPVTT